MDLSQFLTWLLFFVVLIAVLIQSQGNENFIKGFLKNKGIKARFGRTGDVWDYYGKSLPVWGLAFVLFLVILILELG